MKTEPQKEHEWLQRLVGEWTYESECSMEPGKPPEKFEGSESVRSLGGLWVLCEGSGEMPGGGMATTLMTLGYDPQKRQYVGSFVASMMTYLWVYDGSLDGDHRVMTSRMLGDDGKWHEFMTANYRGRSSGSRNQKDNAMRFMIMVKASQDMEAGVMPEEKLIAAMAAYHAELAKAGVLLDASGLKPSSKGWRIEYSGGQRTVIDGPFAETSRPSHLRLSLILPVSCQ